MKQVIEASFRENLMKKHSGKERARQARRRAKAARQERRKKREIKQDLRRNQEGIAKRLNGRGSTVGDGDSVGIRGRIAGFSDGNWILGSVGH